MKARRLTKEDIKRGWVQMECHTEHIFVFDFKKALKAKSVLCNGVLVVEKRIGDTDDRNKQ